MSYLNLDIGGTEIKAGIVKANGTLHDTVKSFPSYAKESKEIILQNIMDILNFLQKNTPDSVNGIGLAFPGPFDYDRGISLLRSLDKFDSLYNINLKHELRMRLEHHPDFSQDVNIPIVFENDVTAFALGASLLPELKNHAKGLYLCIGTGCGSAFLNNGHTLDSDSEGVPKNGWLYPLPFRDSTLDDYISKRGLMRLSKKILGYEADGKKLARLAFDGDLSAQKCFDEFGLLILEGLKPILNSFHPHCLVFGGQIMKSAELFINPIRQYCINNDIFCYITVDTSYHTLLGLKKKFMSIGA